jgi:hypothetical protein
MLIAACSSSHQDNQVQVVSVNMPEQGQLLVKLLQTCIESISHLGVMRKVLAISAVTLLLATVVFAISMLLRQVTIISV